MKLLLVALMLGFTTFANAADVNGQIFMGSAGGDPGIDRAVLSLTQQLDDGWRVKVAGNGAGAAPKLHEASLAGGLLGGQVSVGYQQDVYAALIDSALHTRWIATPYTNVVADRDTSAAYSGNLLGVNYAAQVSDGTPADHRQTYALLLYKDLNESLSVVLGGRYDQAAKTWTSNAAAVYHSGALVGVAEVTQVAPEHLAKTTSYGVTATYSGLYKSVGLYGRIINVDQLGAKNSSLAGLTAPVNKNVAVAGLLSHVDGADDSVVLRLAAAF